MKKLILAVFLFFPLISVAQESVLLRLNYNKGDVYTQKVELNQSMGAQGTMNMNMVINSVVSSADDKNLTLESKIQSVVMTMNQGGMLMSYDSSKSAEELDQMGQMMKTQFDPILQAIIYNSMDRYGNVLEAKMEPNIPGMEQFTENQNAINFPEEKVYVGYSWASEVENQGIKITTKYTVADIGDTTVSLNISGDVSGVGTGVISGNSTVDISSGMQTAATIEMKLSVQGMELITVSSSTMSKI